MIKTHHVIDIPAATCVKQLQNRVQARFLFSYKALRNPRSLLPHTIPTSIIASAHSIYSSMDFIFVTDNCEICTVIF